MIIALAQLNFTIGDFESNTSKIVQTIAEAKKQGAGLLIFPELAVCGYPPRDFLQFHDFISRCQTALNTIAKHTQDIAVIVGAPSKNPLPEGKNLFNSAYFIADKKISFIQHKSLLPNYDVFDEYRYFEPNRHFGIATYKGLRIALTVCEDIWNLGPDPMYVAYPMKELAALNPDFIVNIAASPFSYNQHEKRMQVLAFNATEYKLPIFYVNHVGAQTELIFDGGSMVVDETGKALSTPVFFRENISYFNTENFKKPNIPASIIPLNKTELIYRALITGIRDYFGKMGFKKAILGLSGGIDSALTMVLAAEALGNKNVLGVLMPSQFSSAHSVDDALQLAAVLGCPTHTISIHDAYEALGKTMLPYFKETPFNIAEENMQARIRAVILMALSNKFGHILLNTSNKSEAAVGYGTLYGDMCGGLSVLGDVYKTEVYEIARFINRNTEIIPENIISKAPSAELRPDQKDSDSLPEYDILDKILYQYIEEQKSPQEIVNMGYSSELVSRILKLVNNNEYKRHQCPPILRVSAKAFGTGRRMPVVGKYLQ